MAGRNRKIDTWEMRKMIKQGRTQGDVAKHFGVSRSAVSQAVHSLNKTISKNVQLENANRIVESEIDTLGQLKDINDHARFLLDLCRRWIEGDEEAVKILKERHTDGDRIKFKDPSDVMLRCMAEIRHQLGLQLSIFETLYDMQSVQAFQSEIIQAISEESPALRDKILFRLKEKRVLRQVVGYRK